MMLGKSWAAVIDCVTHSDECVDFALWRVHINRARSPVKPF